MGMGGESHDGLDASDGAEGRVNITKEILGTLGVEGPSTKQMKPPPGFEKRELAQPAVTPDASPSASVAPKIASTASTAQKSSDDAKVSRRPLPPKRQLWIVRVPKPPSEELHPEATSNDGTVSVDEQITTAEAEIARLDGVIRESNDARDSSRAHLAKARDRAREVSDQIRAQLATCKPAQDRLHEIESMDRKIRDAVRSIGGYESVGQIDAELEKLERRMSHESLSVQEQKRLLHSMSKLRGKRVDAAAIESMSTEHTGAKEEKARLNAELRVSRGSVDPMREKEAMARKIYDHYKRAVDTAVVDSSAVHERKTCLVKEIRRLRKEGYEARQHRRDVHRGREKEEWRRARKTVSSARQLVKSGDFAGAEALCTAQMEHVHARLNMDAEYRAKYLEGLKRDRAEREEAARVAIEVDAETTKKAKDDAKADASRAEHARTDAEAARVVEEKERAARTKEEARIRAKEEKAAAAAKIADDALARAEDARRAKAEAAARRAPPPAPVLGPSEITAALARADAEAGADAMVPSGGTAGVPAKPAATDDELRAKRAEKKRRKREKAAADKEAERVRREAHEAHDEAKREERAMRRMGSGRDATRRIPAAADSVSSVQPETRTKPAGMKTMHHKRGKGWWQWLMQGGITEGVGDVAIGAAVGGLAVMMILYVFRSAARELTDQ